jgi:hypothetical protein
MIEDKREEINFKDRQAYLDQALAFTKECRLVINSAISTGLKVTAKPDKSLVTTADIEAEKLFRKRVAETFRASASLEKKWGPQIPQRISSGLSIRLTEVPNLPMECRFMGQLLRCITKGSRLLG